MNLTEILYQPYIISIIIALIFTFIVYLFLKKNNDKKTDKSQQQSYAKTLTISFFCSFIAFLGIIYGMKHLSNTKTMEMSGVGNGSTTISVSDLSDKLNIADNDVDFSLLDN
jgi:hypothetical protein